MGFSWQEDIAKGIAEVSKAVMEEIRDNLDAIKDNEACASDKVSYKGSQQTAVDGGYNSVHYTDEHSSYKNNDNVSYKNNVNIGVDSGYNSGYYSDEHSTYKSGEDTSYKTIYHSINYVAHYSQVYSINRGAVQAIYSWPDCLTHYTNNRGAENSSYDSTVQGAYEF